MAVASLEVLRDGAEIRTAGTIDETLPISKNRFATTRIGLYSHLLDQLDGG
jgi:hypothetical protein